MRQVRALLILATICTQIWAANIHSLYTNHRAMREGDILTVLIVENAKAGSSTNTQTEKANGFSVSSQDGSGFLSFMPTFGANGKLGVDYNGGGDTKRQGEFQATLSARVESVLDNGNLIIKGNKVVKINDEEEIIVLSGVVRPQDIEGNNTVYSFNVANAEITYSGKGSTSDAQRPGPITRFFNWLF